MSDCRWETRKAAKGARPEVPREDIQVSIATLPSMVAACLSNPLEKNESCNTGGRSLTVWV